MTVYVVESWWPYENGEVVAVFTSQKVADAFVKLSRDPDSSRCWSVTEHELRESLVVTGDE